VEEATFSGAGLPAVGSDDNLTGKITTSYSGPCRTVSDQIETAATGYGSVRTICEDAAGRVTSVTETADSGQYSTTYAYDALDNLTGVAQGDQSRTFGYDGLGRLLSATNPESGTTTYGYDNNGNLISRTDAAGAATCYGALAGSTCTDPGYNSSGATGYDGLNRPRQKQYYLGSSGRTATSSVTYTYDEDETIAGHSETNYYHGRLAQVANGASTTAYRYEALGRTQSSQQSTNGVDYIFGYTYNGGGLYSITYPSGRAIGYGRDPAGRIMEVAGAQNGVGTIYAGSASLQDGDHIQYAPQGAISLMKLGSGRYEWWEYNSRLQPTGIHLGTSGSDSSVRALSLDYLRDSQSPASNNGNVYGQTVSGSGLSSAVSQSYGYDRLNRISSMAEGSNSRTFGYDRYGNGWANGFNTQPFTPTSANAYDGTKNQLVYAFENVGYDSAGNQNAIGGYTFSYDAENRMTSAVLASTQATMYRYDGEGRRVAKVVCPSGGSTCDETTAGAQVTCYVTDAQGELAAEYVNYAATQPPCATCYVTGDALGSVRMVTDGAGAAKECHDYLPFGEEILSGTAGRSGYYQDRDVPGLKFTGKLRGESYEDSLDYFGARYFSGTQGRFMSPDPGNAGASLTDPQNWNAYAYVRNSPLRLVDPNGLEPTCYLDGIETDCGMVMERISNGSATAATSTSKGRTTTITQSDGTIVQRTGNVAFRDNNPGDLRPGPFTKRHGQIGVDPAVPYGPFAVFETSPAGELALRALLASPDLQGRSILEEMKNFAPVTDRNDPVKYAQDLAKALGVAMTAPLSSLSPAQLDLFVEKIKQAEGFYDPKGTVKVIK
jgi:RHS repeat-associated protein